jgi:Transposase DDE domain
MCSGVSVVLLVWTDGPVRLPLAVRPWHKGGPSKFTLALELLSYARNRLRCKPQFVRFDSWYPLKPLLKRLRDYGWYVVFQLNKHRRFAGRPLVRSLQQPYWHARGCLSEDLKVFVVRYRRTDYATNRLSLSAQEVRALYRKRQEVEEVIRVLKSQLSLEGCHAGYRRSSAKQALLREGRPRASYSPVPGGLPGGGAGAPRLRGYLAPTQAPAHPPRVLVPCQISIDGSMAR